MNIPVRVLSVILLAGVAAGCRAKTSANAPIQPERNMFEQQRYDAQERSHFFSDGRTMRTPVVHTVSRSVEPSPEISNGELADGSGYVMTVPDSVVSELGGMASAVHRGQQRFNIYCRPCHDGAGTGHGTAVQRGMAQPPSLHDPRVRHMPDGQMFATISHGVRNMPAYNYAIPVDDRWAIVSYVRALELSQVGEQ